MVNPTYRWLEAHLRMGMFTLRSWVVIALTVLGSAGLAKVLPMPDMWALSSALTILGIPACLLIVAEMADFNLGGLAVAAVRWRLRRQHLFLAGSDPANPPTGYVVGDPTLTTHTDTTDRPEAGPRIEDLWA